MNKEKLERGVLLMLGIIAGAVLLYASVRLVLPIVSPFLIAWGVAYLVRRPAEKISRVTRIPEKIVRLILAIGAALFAFGAFGVLVWQLIAALWRLLSDLGEGGALYDLLVAISSPKLSLFGSEIPEELATKISDALGRMLTEAFTGLASALTSWVSVVPRALLFLLVSLISLVYFSLDLENIGLRLGSLLPRGAARRLSVFREELFGVIGKYMKSYLLLMLITFSVMLAGFLLLGVDSAFLIAAVVAFLDLLPVIGVGTVLVPWSVISFISGNGALGIGLAVLFVANEVIRQIAEPKILGKNLNMHPILTLAALYIGYALFGLMGLINVPIFAVLVGFLFKNGSSADIGEGSV